MPWGVAPEFSGATKHGGSYNARFPFGLRGNLAMHIRCPHCHNAMEVVGDSDLADVACPSCGSAFNLANVAPETEHYDPKPRMIGHFQLLDQLGMGAFGAVWKARDTKLDRIVAIKIPRRDQVASVDHELFLREARAAAQLKHPNIVAVHEVGREDGTLYIVSDFIQGITLAYRLTTGLYTPREAADLSAQIGTALHHAHEAGVIHRDLKPSNIMLDGAGQPHIMDFGLAKREVGEITMTVEGKSSAPRPTCPPSRPAARPTRPTAAPTSIPSASSSSSSSPAISPSAATCGCCCTR